MNKDPLNIPPSRTWRDIPQPVKPRVMSRGGRWRLALSGLRVAAGVGAVVAVGFGGWKVAAALGKDAGAMPAAAKAVPIKTVELTTGRGGVLTSEWLVRTLALPKHASLMQLDLEQLRARILGDGQVRTATLRRHFPDRLVVEVTERMPVARLMVDFGGLQQPLLVARDGVMFAGDGYDAAMLATLPWLDGAHLARKNGELRPLEGMSTVADLLVRARFEAAHLYASWRVVSLARLASDREIEVRTLEGHRVVFGANADYLLQLAKLDLLWDRIGAERSPPARIDLSLGEQVPVMIEATAVALPASGPRTGLLTVPANASAAAGAPAAPRLTFSL